MKLEENKELKRVIMEASKSLPHKVYSPSKDTKNKKKSERGKDEKEKNQEMLSVN